jgi:isopentenyl-diphosphate delta-isomerase type 1
MADNPDEQFDVVDEHDRVVGVARRADVHANGWLHRAVHIMVQRPDGAVFIQKRSMEKDCHPGVWDSSASGHLDSGEYYDTAAIRELEEELGISVGEIDEIGALPASEITGQEFVRIYRVAHAGPFTLHPSEIEDGKWVAVAALDKWVVNNSEDFAPCFTKVWETVRSAFSDA